MSIENTGCQTFGQITWSVRDTPETSTQVRRHNRKYVELCGPVKEQIAQAAK